MRNLYSSGDQFRYGEYAWWFILLVVGLFILLCPTYLRGSDQFWYTADAASIAHGFHLGTNNLFPNSFTGHWYAPQRPFVHNRPVIYLVGFVDVLIRNTVFSWKLVNLILLLLTTMIVRSGVATLLKEAHGPAGARRLGSVAGILYLLMPFNFWLVFQPLSTIADGFFSALIFLYLFPRWLAATGGKQVVWWLLLLVASVLAVFDRKDYLLLLSLGLIAWLWSRRQLWSKYLLFIPALVFGVWLCSPLFPGHLIVRFPVYRLILESSPGASNMVSFLDPHIGDYSMSTLIGILIPKALHDLRIQILPQLKLLPFYYIFNILILIIILGLIGGKDKLDRRVKNYCWLTIGMLASFFILIMGYQNHYRYMVSILPVAVAVAFLICFYLYDHYEEYGKQIRFLTIIVIFLLVILDAGVTVNGLRSDKKEHREAVLLGKALNQYVKASEPLISEWTGNAQMIGYMHRPGPCLYIDSQFVLENPGVFRNPRVDWVVTNGNSAVKQALQKRISVSYQLPEGFVLNKLKK